MCHPSNENSQLPVSPKAHQIKTALYEHRHRRRKSRICAGGAIVVQTRDHERGVGRHAVTRPESVFHAVPLLRVPQHRNESVGIKMSERTREGNTRFRRNYANRSRRFVCTSM